MLKFLIEMTVVLNISGEMKQFNQETEILVASNKSCEEIAYDVSSTFVNNSVKNSIEALEVIGMKASLENVNYVIHCEG